LIVLAVDAAQIAVTEKDIARAVCTDERRLFAKMRCVGGDYWQATGITGGYLVFQTIVQAVAWADTTAFEHRFQRFDAPFKLACFKQAKIRRRELALTPDFCFLSDVFSHVS
jgi:hypothetical protein